jgi:signal transduction histidine kinase
VESDAIDLEVRDDGVGFDPATVRPGRGLANLRRRAADVGASLAIDGATGRGACVRLRLPRGMPSA